MDAQRTAILEMQQTELGEDEALLTLDALLEIDDERVEILEGEVKKMAAAGVAHHLIGGNFYRVIDPFVVEQQLGIVFFDGLTYLMNSDEGGLKHSFVPDVSFIHRDQILGMPDIHKPYPGIPTLAIEVVSPNDHAGDLQSKLQTYLEKGTEQVWITFPITREIYQYRRNHSPYVTIYQDSQTLSVDDLFPGLVLTTEMIFRVPPWFTME
jgi:Uma2 family endonuclease